MKLRDMFQIDDCLELESIHGHVHVYLLAGAVSIMRPRGSFYGWRLDFLEAKFAGIRNELTYLAERIFPRLGTWYLDTYWDTNHTNEIKGDDGQCHRCKY